MVEQTTQKQPRTNKLNELTGKEWIKFTKSWFIHNPPPREDTKMLHPACFPETLVEEFIKFFTKRYQWVLDPFLGTGSTLVAAQNSMRNGIGIEIYPEYAEIARKRLSQKKLLKHEEVREIVIVGDSRNIVNIFKEYNLPKVDFCITSPPYWNQLKRNYIRQKERGEKGLDTYYGDKQEDIGNIDDYKQFISEQKKIFDGVYEVLKDFGYLVIITNNVFYEGRLYPLAFDTLISLSKKWVPKDEKIWLQNDKPLLPLGIYNAWVGNRCHQYCLIFRKEPEKLEKDIADS
ncbi:site-specific DNA-methyltransferase [Candidatus Bathyarchaeota archaeon]|nr:MAG: site-specific DNA-methyltransferase [Candidatus Bathyarchaeota archaeon]